MCLLILHGACIIEGFHPVVSLLEVWTIACLITQTPHDDTRMVLETDHVTLLTLDVHLLEGRILRQRLLAITHAMTLKIRLRREIDTILVAEVIPTGIIRIVTGAYRINIQLFHNLYILDHTVDAHDIAIIRIEFMTVSTFDEDRLTVDEQLPSLDLNMTEAHLLAHSLQHLITFLQLQL